MVDMGAEVGQKMRSAIKAKLTELDCYVDDELPDYIMVMVANKRTKTQMNEDLSLFLNRKTSVFVDWLHIVLKKLKEVSVTNLDVYKKASKRKSNEYTNAKVHQKKIKKEYCKNTDAIIFKQEMENNQDKSLTDDLPLNVKSLTENRKIVLIPDKPQNSLNQSFDIPSLSEIEQPSLMELKDIESQIKNVKSRLGFKIDQEVDESELQQLIENNKKIPNECEISSNRRQAIRESKYGTNSNITGIEDNPKRIEFGDTNDHSSNVRKEHSKIIFSKKDFRSPSRSPPRKKSIHDRLGTYGDEKTKSVLSRLGNYSLNEKKEDSNTKRTHSKYVKERKLKEIRVSDIREKNKSILVKNGVLQSGGVKDLRSQLSVGGSVMAKNKDLKKRLGLSSKVTIPPMDPQLLEDTFKKREVVSVIKVKPRILPPNVQQANKNLLLKAVADAQKSIAQSKSVGQNHKNTSTIFGNPDVRYKEDDSELLVHTAKTRKVSEVGKEILKQFLSSQSDESSDQEYIPIPIKRTEANVKYVPSSLDRNVEENDENAEKKHKFIVTLDGIQKSDMVARLSVKDRLDTRTLRSPIIFDVDGESTKTKRNIPQELPTVPVTISKKKEKCKYYPSCKNGERCEFIHPAKMCEQFPYCKFGDKCLYIHPNCKFGNSCTKRGCPFVHLNEYGAKNAISAVPVKTQVLTVQICKFFPKCTNLSCSFFHPKPCKYGIYCKNQSGCNYIHSAFSTSKSLTWKAK
ncbi:zinc finger CCCH domain-containing protein 14 isoform X1 [Harmonia axyridis]|uniref:zinc finger CCCH domain-containing protein 14 isoform X1 n=2 Tax=Harmonia axyridis TaxID=115357 RepID=UPI001E278128|nr:zinc finger CCCH domain-containing protein 14 isoform X1 [Harmonia axyridis]